MKRFIVALFLISSALVVGAQQRTVDEVKKSIGDLSANLNTFTTAQTKLKPALTHDATKDLSETWVVAGKVEFGIYDKNRVNKSLGNAADVKVMGKALITGYDYFHKALSLDSVKELNRDGSVKIDKKTGRPKVKTKFSKEIVGRLNARVLDFGAMGTELYKAKDWENAYRAWEIYFAMVASPNVKSKYKEVPDSVLGATRFYQGLAASQMKRPADAHRLFADAILRGYQKKTVYDNDLNVLFLMGDTVQAVSVARQAYSLYGKQDVRYMQIMINDCLSKNDMKDAEVMLDQAILMDSLNANYYTIKGDIVESRSSFLAARPYYVRAVELSPDEYSTNFNVGRSYYMEALQYIKDNPKKVGKKLLKAIEPMYRESLKYMEKAYQIQPNNIDARSILRDIYYQLGDGENLERVDQ